MVPVNLSIDGTQEYLNSQLMEAGSIDLLDGAGEASDLKTASIQ